MVGKIRIETTSAFIHKNKKSNKDRDFNPGVNTFRFYDQATNTIYNADRETAPGEWGGMTMLIYLVPILQDKIFRCLIYVKDLINIRIFQNTQMQ